MHAESPWNVVLSALWAHSQGAVSAVATLWKPDVYQAFVAFCQALCCRTSQEQLERESSQFSLYGFESEGRNRLHSSLAQRNMASFDNVVESISSSDDPGQASTIESMECAPKDPVRHDGRQLVSQDSTVDPEQVHVVSNG